jgi:hypothetical protein
LNGIAIPFLVEFFKRTPRLCFPLIDPPIFFDLLDQNLNPALRCPVEIPLPVPAPPGNPEISDHRAAQSKAAQTMEAHPKKAAR